MNTKLTLTIEETVVEKAKKYAKDKGASVSGIIENYLKAITSEPENPNVEITLIVKSLKGAFREPDDFDYKKELAKILSEKYL